MLIKFNFLFFFFLLTKTEATKDGIFISERYDMIRNETLWIFICAIRNLNWQPKIKTKLNKNFLFIKRIRIVLEAYFCESNIYRKAHWINDGGKSNRNFQIFFSFIGLLFSLFGRMQTAGAVLCIFSAFHGGNFIWSDANLVASEARVFFFSNLFNLLFQLKISKNKIIFLKHLFIKRKINTDSKNLRETGRNKWFI